MKLGFFFGAGAEVGYGLPTGGKFALDIFRHNTRESKQQFKAMLDNVDTDSYYGSHWLPPHFRDKNISSFGKGIYLHIIKDTIEQNNYRILDKLSNFDKIAAKQVKRFRKDFNMDIDEILQKFSGKTFEEIASDDKPAFLPEFMEGDKLFGNVYLAALVSVYKNKKALSEENREELGLVITSILQLYVGSLAEKLSRRLNDGVFIEKGDEENDIFDNIGDIFLLNYASSGLSGLEHLITRRKPPVRNDEDALLKFSRRILEAIFSDVLDYKSLIDSNWHYIYCPSSDWAQFSKICMFQLTVRDYILNTAEKGQARFKWGYYHLLRDALDRGLYEATEIATVNYNTFIKDMLRQNVTFFNGSTELWYDPYLNKVGYRDQLQHDEKHVIVPFIFTQSGTKPITSIEISKMYVDSYEAWKKSDAIVVVGFGFGLDDEHINGIFRTLVDQDGKRLLVVTLDIETNTFENITNKLKVRRKDLIDLVLVHPDGKDVASGLPWTEEIVNRMHSHER